MDEQLIHKETFHQASQPEFGIPSSWVVQYWVGSSDNFPQAQYFSSETEAVSFEKKCTNGTKKILKNMPGFLKS